MFRVALIFYLGMEGGVGEIRLPLEAGFGLKPRSEAGRIFQRQHAIGALGSGLV